MMNPKRMCFVCSIMSKHRKQIMNRTFSTSRVNMLKTVDNYSNPINSLQEFVEVPLLSDSNQVFSATLDEMKEAEDIFVSKNNSPINHIKSIVNLKNLPELSVPEVAFIGRSNVGKSSLIKALFHQAPHVNIKTSKKPGHTRALHFFQVGNHFTLVDMPGYGYNMPEHFDISVEHYLKTRKRLTRTFVLIDGSIGITKTDEIGLEMLAEFKIPYVIILTKIDKGNSYVLVKNVMSVISYIEKNTFNLCLTQPFLVSSMTHQGLPLLQSFIAYITGSIEVSVNQ